MGVASTENLARQVRNFYFNLAAEFLATGVFISSILGGRVLPDGVGQVTRRVPCGHPFWRTTPAARRSVSGDPRRTGLFQGRRQ